MLCISELDYSLTSQIKLINDFYEYRKHDQ